MTALQAQLKLEQMCLDQGVPDAPFLVKTFVQRAGMKRVAAILADANIWSAFRTLCTELNIAVSTASTSTARAVDHLQVNDPWAKGEVSSKPTKKKERRKQRTGDLLNGSKIDLSFFAEEGCPSPPAVSLAALLHGEEGISCVSPDEWLKHSDAVLGGSLTVGASAIVIVGRLDIVSDRMSHQLVPGWSANKPAAFRVTLVQTGDVPLTWPSCSKRLTACAAFETTVLMVHVHRSEVVAHWSDLANGLTCYLHKTGLVQHKLFAMEWATSFYRGAAKVSVGDAEYYHSVVRVEDKHLDEALRVSGAVGVYLTPKGPDRGVDPRFRVMSFPALPLEKVLVLQSKLGPTACGLSRSRKGLLGIRVRIASYKSSKKVLNPDESTDSEAPDGAVSWTVLGLPETLDRSGVRRALRQLGWKVWSLASSGWRSWQVASSAEPPCRSFAYGSAEIVIMKLAAVVDSKVFAAGASRRFASAETRTTSSLAFGSSETSADVWGSGSHARLDSVRQQVAEEIKAELMSELPETRNQVALHSSRLDAIEKQLVAISGAHDELVEKVEAVPALITSQLEDSWRSHCERLCSVEAKVDSGFLELKELFLTSQAKVRKVSEGP